MRVTSNRIATSKGKRFAVPIHLRRDTSCGGGSGVCCHCSIRTAIAGTTNRARSSARVVSTKRHSLVLRARLGRGVYGSEPFGVIFRTRGLGKRPIRIGNACSLCPTGSGSCGRLNRGPITAKAFASGGRVAFG